MSAGYTSKIPYSTLLSEYTMYTIRSNQKEKNYYSVRKWGLRTMTAVHRKKGKRFRRESSQMLPLFPIIADRETLKVCRFRVLSSRYQYAGYTVRYQTLACEVHNANDVPALLLQSSRTAQSIVCSTDSFKRLVHTVHTFT